MKFKPLNDKVLILKVNKRYKTQKGIIIPETVKESSNEGIVVAIGDGIKNKKGVTIPLNLKIGERVMFTKWCGTDIKINEKCYLIMKESDILGIIKN